jgi:hypothetical protein
VAAAGVTSLLFIVWDIAMKRSFQVGGPRSTKYDVNMRRAVKSLNCTRVVPALAKAGSSIRLWSSWPATSG